MMGLDRQRRPDLLAGNAAGGVRVFTADTAGAYAGGGMANAGGAALSVAPGARISLAWGPAGRPQALVIGTGGGRVLRCAGRLAGDADDDGVVGFFDYMTFTNAWNTREGDAAYVPAVNLELAPAGPQAIDFFDYLAFVRVWGLGL
jgi:hypothetical protein